MEKRVFGLVLPLLILVVLALLVLKGEGFGAVETDGRADSERGGETLAAMREATLTSAYEEVLLQAPTTEILALMTKADPVTDRKTVPDTEVVSVMAAVTEGTSGKGALVTEFADAFVVIPEEEGKHETVVTGFADTLPLKLPVAKPYMAEEMEAVYVATAYGLDFPSVPGLSERELKGELEAMVERVKKQGANAVIFQVRPFADAFYDSAIFPVSRYLAGVEGGKLTLDPLAFLVELAHREGIAVHVWVNPFRVGALSTLSPQNPAAKHPEWLLFVGGGVYFDPALEGVRRLITDGVCELVAKYDLDGVLFDDYFYPSGIEGEDASAYADYLAGGGSLSLGDFRRENVNRLIESVYKAVKALDEDCQLGVAPRGVWRNAADDPRGSETYGGSAYDEIYCDALAWVERGIVDYLAPQLYWPLDSEVCPFGTLAAWWDGALSGSGISLVVSLAAYTMSEKEIADQIDFLQGLATYGGYALYRP